MKLRRPSSAAWLVLALIVVMGAALILHAGRNGTFFYDEWDFIQRRRGMGDDALLGPHNGHLSLVPVLAYKIMLQGVGLEHYWPYRTLLVGLHALTVVALFFVVRRRTGVQSALCAAALLMVLGAAGDDLVWAFQIGFVGSVAAGLGMLLALDRRDQVGDVLAAVALAVALASSSLGVPVAVVAVVELAVLREPRRLLRVAGPPLGLYALWRLGYGTSDLRFGNLDDTPGYAFGMLAAAAQGLTGITAVATTVAVAVAAAFAVALARSAVTPRLVAVLAGLVAFFALTSLARAQFGDPGASRYVYLTVVLILLGAAEVWPHRLRTGRPAAVVGGLVAVACLGNILLLNTKARELGQNADALKGSLVAIELARERVSPDFQPAPSADPQLVARLYFPARDAFGSPVAGGLSSLRENGRREADRVLTRLEIQPPALVARARRTTGCAATPGGDVPLERGASFVVVAHEQPIELRFRRFDTDVTGAPYGSLASGQAARMAIAADREAQPWVLRVSGPASVCRP